ncbi:unnamed protein product [Oncorhynchus mykiss]|uniref:Uncharacterized protein n=1 Tax=Oncorhynchus mykiss TaxID=8022 RepID=A0A060YIF3_ONCMY|nr:unnamed protein product [Oncorhynchus mykiss]
MVQDEETLELKETFSSLQQEVEAKTKKLKKLYAKLQCVKAEIQDVNDEHVRSRQELEQTQNQLTRELKFKYLIIENFIPPEEKNKIMNRLTFDPEEDQWKFTPLVPAERSGWVCVCICIFSICICSVCICSVCICSVCIFSICSVCICSVCICICSVCIFSICSVCICSVCIFSICICSIYL